MEIMQEGYVVDVPYPTFVHRQAMPVWLTTILQLKGYQTPDLKKKFRYLELGCAMGIHLHLTASAHPNGHFVGVDFNAQQLMVAQEGIEYTQIQNVEFIHAGFQDFLTQDIEPFDFIVTHGVWSWVSEENQHVIEQIVKKLLKPNGVFYCAYMSHPGATGLTSVQKLMFEMSRNLQGDSSTKAVQSLNLVRRLGQTKMGLFEHVPQLNQALAELAQDKPNYIAHDFLSEHWQPQHSADMIRRFGQHQLAYSAGAGIMENLDAISLSPDVRKIVQSLPLVPLQETVKDIARHTLQRQDVYIAQRQKLTEQQQRNVYDQLKFGLLPDAPVGKKLKQDAKVGHIEDALPIFEAILKFLQHADATISQLQQQLKLNISHKQLSEVLLVLVWAGYIHPMYPSQPNLEIETAMNTWMVAQELSWRCLQKFGTAIELKTAV